MPLLALCSCNSVWSFSIKIGDKCFGTMLTRTLLSMLPRPSISMISLEAVPSALKRYCSGSAPFLNISAACSASFGVVISTSS